MTAWHIPPWAVSRRAYGAALALVALAAVAILVYATRTWGLGVSYDSVVYVQASHDLSSVSLPQPRDAGGEPLYWWAPLYPLLLAVFGGDYGGALVLNALLLFVGTVLAGAVMWRFAGATAGMTAGALYALSPTVFTAHSNLLAEPLFLVLATGALALIAADRGGLAGVMTGAAVLTRYAGLPLLLTGGLVLRGRARLRFLGASLALVVAWLIRNQVMAGELTGRTPAWHPPTMAVARRGVSALAQVAVTPGRLPSLELPAVDPGRVVQALVALTLVLAILRVDLGKAPRLVRIGLVYAALYCAFLLLTISVFDAGTPLDARLLVGVVPSFVFAAAWVLAATPIAAVTVCVLFGVATLQQARTTSLYGIDYSGRIWAAARVDVDRLPAGRLYSNWPAAIAYFTGRSPRYLPRRADPHTLEPNKSYQGEVATLADAVRTGTASLVVLRNAFLELEDVAPLTSAPAFRSRCQNLTAVVIVCRGPDRRPS